MTGSTREGLRWLRRWPKLAGSGTGTGAGTDHGRLPRRPRAAAPQTIKIAVDEALYTVRLRRHRQARRYTLQIHPLTREAVLTLPMRGNLAEARQFAEQHRHWIAARLARLPQACPFAPGMKVPIGDVTHTIVHRPHSRGTVWRETGADGEALLCVAGGAAHLERRVRDYLKREARRALGDSVARHAATLGVRPARLAVRDQASRWGSCSAAGVLSFSWRLILAPPFVLDYLAAHEVAHLMEMNHSPRFWRLVAQLHGDVATAKAWLDANSHALHSYGATEAAASTWSGDDY